MHSNIEQALKALHTAEEVYNGSLANIEGQYLRSLASAHDGDSAECLDIKAQVASVRAKYLKASVDAPSADPVKPRFGSIVGDIGSFEGLVDVADGSVYTIVDAPKSAKKKK